MKNASAGLALAALLAASAANAAPFTGKGLPADSVAFVHVDCDASTGAFATALKNFTKNGGKKPGETAKVLAEFGVSSENVSDLSVGVAAGDGSKPAISGVVHGNFDASKFKGVATRHPEVATKTAGGLTWFSADDIAKIAGAGKANPNASPDDTVYVAMSGSDTLVFATAARLEKAAAAASGKSASYVVPTAAKASLAGSPSLVAWIPEAAVKIFQQGKAPTPGEPALKALSLTLAEASGNVNLDAIATMSDAKGAQQANSMAGMYQGFGAMMLAQQAQKGTAKAKGDAELLISMLKAIKVSASGADLDVAFSYPADKLAAKFTENQGEIMKAAEGAAK